MLGLVFDPCAAANPLSVRDDLPRPVPAAGEALIRVTSAGVCQTDLEIAKGYMGFSGVMGHEFVGVVEDGPAAWIARRVVGEINCPCGHCSLCKAGLGNHCPSRTVLGIVGCAGCFAEYVTLPVANLHAVPEGVCDEQAVFTEPLAAGFEILEQVAITADSRVAVLGDGKLGLLCAMAMRTTGAELLVVGKHPEKLAHAHSRDIATALLDELTLEKTWDVVVEATGSPTGLATAMQLIQPRGTIVLKSTFAASDATPPNLAPLVIDEVTLVGSRCGPFDKALDALSKGGCDPRDLITARYPLAQALDALAAAKQPNQIKVLLNIS